MSSQWAKTRRYCVVFHLPQGAGWVGLSRLRSFRGFLANCLSRFHVQKNGCLSGKTLRFHRFQGPRYCLSGKTASISPRFHRFHRFHLDFIDFKTPLSFRKDRFWKDRPCLLWGDALHISWSGAHTMAVAGFASTRKSWSKLGDHCTY